ncbi:MAG: hypothetical protein JO009_03990 [Candidatus Eremiobacteraeota bacterium]|nr:hypothetical protein [Candidatus Eremiobacteraeota bacterium]
MQIVNASNRTTEIAAFWRVRAFPERTVGICFYLMSDVKRVRATLWSIANVAAVTTIAVFSAFYLILAIVPTLNGTLFGDFGLTVDATWHHVNAVTPGSPADHAGVQVGEGITPVHLRDRLSLVDFVWPTTGERATYVVERASGPEALTLIAVQRHGIVALDTILQILFQLAFIIWLMLGAVLATRRPSKVTWGFYLTGVAWMWIVAPTVITFIPDALLLVYNVVWQLLVCAGIVGFLVFSLRFPTNQVTGWRAKLDSIAPLYFLALSFLTVFGNLPAFVNVRPELARWVGPANDVVLVAEALVSILCATSLIGTYRSSLGLERERMKWVVFGLVCAGFSGLSLVLVIALPTISPSLGYLTSSWVGTLGALPVIVLPLSVGYAVARHRVIDVRFVASRALVYGMITLIAMLLLVLCDWLFSKQFSNSRGQTAVFGGITLLVGLSLNAARQRIGKLIDSLFFRQRHRTELRTSALSDAMHKATSKTDLYGPLTTGIADTYFLASVALFEQLGDGGLVRVAAEGWPPGSLWHLLPDDPVAKRVGSLRPMNIEALSCTEESLPAGVARPSLMIPIVTGKIVPAILLCGAHKNGTALDPDEMRSIRRLCADAGLVYGTTRASEIGAVPARRSEFQST